MQTLLKIKLPARIEHLERYRTVVSECAKEQGVAQERIFEIELAIEEAFVNICNYSYPEKPGDVEINCKIDDSHFTIEMIDSGIPFDVTLLPDPNLTANIDERKIGGLGVFLIKRMMDEVRYHRENDQNILDLIIKMAKG